ncbi:hypothetical protein IJ670_04910 [bacterium]|nr:hypothetical protein [bacterium]
MKEGLVTQYNLLEFAKILRKEDKKEVVFSLGKNFENKFVNIILKHKKHTHMLFYQNIPIAIGGVCPENKKAFYGLKAGKVWLLSSYLAPLHWKNIFRFLNFQLDIYKENYDFLYNYIYKSNYASISWIKKIGFEVVDLDNSDFKLFYFMKGD